METIIKTPNPMQAVHWLNKGYKIQSTADKMRYYYKNQNNQIVTYNLEAKREENRDISELSCTKLFSSYWKLYKEAYIVCDFIGAMKALNDGKMVLLDNYQLRQRRDGDFVLVSDKLIIHITQDHLHRLDWKAFEL